MINSIILLRKLKFEKQLLSNRQVAQLLEISHSTVNRIEKGGVWSDDLACEIADMLGLDVDLVLLSIITERSKNKRAMQAFERLIEEDEEKRIA